MDNICKLGTYSPDDTQNSDICNMIKSMNREVLYTNPKMLSKMHPKQINLDEYISHDDGNTDDKQLTSQWNMYIDNRNIVNTLKPKYDNSTQIGQGWFAVDVNNDNEEYILSDVYAEEIMKSVASEQMVIALMNLTGFLALDFTVQMFISEGLPLLIKASMKQLNKQFGTAARLALTNALSVRNVPRALGAFGRSAFQLSKTIATPMLAKISIGAGLARLGSGLLKGFNIASVLFVIVDLISPCELDKPIDNSEMKYMIDLLDKHFKYQMLRSYGSTTDGNGNIHANNNPSWPVEYTADELLEQYTDINPSEEILRSSGVPISGNGYIYTWDDLEFFFFTDYLNTLSFNSVGYPIYRSVNLIKEDEDFPLIEDNKNNDTFVSRFANTFSNDNSYVKDMIIKYYPILIFIFVLLLILLIIFIYYK